MAGVTKQLLSTKVRTSLAEDEDSDDEAICPRVPFSCDSEHIKLRTSSIDKENENSPHRVASPKSKFRIPLEDTENAMELETDQNNNSQPNTPMKPNEEMEAPLTPTANLKMLFSAVSPEIRKMQSRLEEQTVVQVQSSLDSAVEEANDDVMCSSQESDNGKTTVSRKEKSLGLLCQKFLQKYPEYPDPSQNLEICLDEVAKELAVERRRIYDIVNVLESVEIVSRVAKNRYAWHGKTNLVTTLAKLKALAENEGFAEQMSKLKEMELSRGLLGEQNPGTIRLPIEVGEKGLRKDKSLGIMSQKFLMLFLVSQPKTVNLDLSAKILIGDPLIDRTESAKFKTKIRRLYDIANILTSLDLIRKVHVTEVRGRKPAFRYIGPDVDNVNNIGLCCSDGCHRPSSRHSMLDCVKNASVANLVNMYRPIHPQRPVSYPSAAASMADVRNSFKVEATSDVPRRFSRHASFEQICQVAEKERSKLYGCSSEPSSPVKKLDFDESSEAPPRPGLTKSQSTPTNAKKPYIIFQDGQLTIVQNTQNAGCPVQSAGIGNTVKKTNALIVKTKGIGGPENLKQPTMIPLSRDQIDAVLRSLKVPVVMNKNSSQCVDASTQSSPETTIIGNSPSMKILEQRSASPDCTLASMNERTPHAPPERRAIKRHYISVKDVDKVDKRIRLAIPTPPSTEEESGASSSDSFSHTPDSEVDAITQRAKRKVMADRRALHLAPEFRNSPPTCSVQRKPTPETFKRITASELELAAPLADDEDSPRGKSSKNGSPQAGTTNLAPTMQRVTIQLPNQQPMSVFQVPVTSSDSVKMTQSPPLQNYAPAQLVNRVPVAPNGQPVSFMVPLTFSPPLTPSSPTVFTLPTSQHVPKNMTYTSVHVMQPHDVTSTLKSPSTLQMIIPPAQPIHASSKSFIQHKASSSFKPVPFSQDPKTAIRKLSLSDLC